VKHSVVLAIIDALLSERFSSLELPKGPRGFRGKPGHDFVLQDHIEEVTELIGVLFDGNKESFKLNFNDLTPEDKEELTLKFESLSIEEIKSLRGPRGQKGKSGRFVFEDHQYDIDLLLQDYIKTLDLNLKYEDLKPEQKEELKLTFDKLTTSERIEIKGEIGAKGPRGKTGIEGLSTYQIWSQCNTGTELDFLNSLIGLTGENGERGDQGPRGQRGKVGTTGNSAYQVWLEDNKGTEEDYRLSIIGPKGEIGNRGARGPVGPMGLNAPKAKDGKDGIDAPRIVDVELEKSGKDKIAFIFKFSDGSEIETGDVSIPTIQQLAYSIVSSGGGGGGLSSINVSDGITNLDTAEILFNGATVVNNAGVAEVTIDTNCITAADEGATITNCVKTFDFIGADVTAETCTTIADWPTMAAIDFIGTWEAVNPGLVKVRINSNALLPDVPCDASVYVTAAVKMDATGTALNALADSLANSNVIGIVENKPTPTTCDIRVGNITLSVFAGLDVTKQYYLSAITPGALLTTIPLNSGEVILKVGQPFSGTELLVDRGQATVRI